MAVKPASPADGPPAPSKSWKIEINPSHPHRSRIYYKGELVGLVRALNCGIDVDNPTPYIEFSVFTRDVEIETKDEPPPGI